MEQIVRTVYGSFLQTNQLLGLPFSLIPNTTLNEKFNIQSGIAPAAGTYGHMNYWGIGSGGHRFVTGSNGVAIPQPIQHKATDAALFNHLPFVLRTPDNDLSPAQRASYALRRQETHNGQPYIAYYLKRFSIQDVLAAMEYRVVNNGVTSISAFTPNSSNLNPTPPELSSNGVNTLEASYVATTAKINLSLTEDEVNEILHACEVIYDDAAYAIISEVALCGGVDKTVSAAGISGSFNYAEAIAVQVLNFFSTMTALQFSSQGVTIALDVGSTEPLFQLTT